MSIMKFNIEFTYRDCRRKFKSDSLTSEQQNETYLKYFQNKTDDIFLIVTRIKVLEQILYSDNQNTME